MKNSKQRPRAKGRIEESQSSSNLSSEFQNSTPLLFAALEGNIEKIKTLLETNTYDLNSIGERNYTALHFAANAGELEVTLLSDFSLLSVNINVYSTKICKLLLEAGANPSIKTDNGDTPLNLLVTHHFTNINLRNEVLELLVEKGANISHKNAMGANAIDLVCFFLIFKGK